MTRRRNPWPRAAIGAALVLVAAGLSFVVQNGGPGDGGAVRAERAMPAPLPDVTEETVAPGLALRLESVADPSASDAQNVRLVALHVPEGTPPSALLPPGPFKAMWTGSIDLRIRDRYAFTAQGRGSIKLTVNDEVVLESSGNDLSAETSELIRLNKGRNTIAVEYASPDAGDATMRLYWSGRDFPPEPIPPTVFAHDATPVELRQAGRVRAGRTLFATLRCAQCHKPGDELHLSDGQPMPELATDAPDLAAAGSRLNASWMASWISDPHDHRPDASMPRVFDAGAGEGEVAEQARHIASYLATLGEPAPDQPALDDADLVAAGGHLFLDLGCIACHTPPDAPVSDDATADRTPLRDVAAKYKPRALMDYLKQPHEHYRWTRMPDFRLSDDEATQLASFLVSRAPADATKQIEPGDPAKGKTLLAASGCLNCHAAEQETSTFSAPSLSQILTTDWTAGCMAPHDAASGAAPEFDLSDDQRASLRAFAAGDLRSLGRTVPAEFAHRQMEILNCAACHTIDNQQDVWSSIGPEIDAVRATLPPKPEPEGESPYAPDQSRPRLTWAGEKLRPDHMARIIAGDLSYKPRPWLQARMPGFPARAKLLSAGLAMQHGFGPEPEPQPEPDMDLADLGRKLAGREGPNGGSGFQCNACHAIADEPATAAFEAPAPNFMRVRERVRRHYYDRWMLNPQRVEPGTRMPSFADVDGVTSLRQVYDGDARQQFDAIWHYLMRGADVEAP